MLSFLIQVLASIIGSGLMLVVWFHWDIEGFWQQRRLAHGEKLDQRALDAARKHGSRGPDY